MNFVLGIGSRSSKPQYYFGKDCLDRIGNILCNQKNVGNLLKAICYLVYLYKKVTVQVFVNNNEVGNLKMLKVFKSFL